MLGVLTMSTSYPGMKMLLSILNPWVDAICQPPWDAKKWIPNRLMLIYYLPHLLQKVYLRHVLANFTTEFL